MTAHKHAEMIRAKADNMELVVFAKSSNSDLPWVESTFKTLISNFDNDLFLCLPQHKEACLHWLNGGEVQYKGSGNWLECGLYKESPRWEPVDWMMSEYNEYRIKPRKEKRWIAVDIKTGHTTKAYKTKDECDMANFSGCAANADGYQFIEIEVEV